MWNTNGIFLRQYNIRVSSSTASVHSGVCHASLAWHTFNDRIQNALPRFWLRQAVLTVNRRKNFSSLQCRIWIREFSADGSRANFPSHLIWFVTHANGYCPLLKQRLQISNLLFLVKTKTGTYRLLKRKSAEIELFNIKQLLIIFKCYFPPKIFAKNEVVIK